MPQFFGFDPNKVSLLISAVYERGRLSYRTLIARQTLVRPVIQLIRKV